MAVKAKRAKEKNTAADIVSIAKDVCNGDTVSAQKAKHAEEKKETKQILDQL